MLQFLKSRKDHDYRAQTQQTLSRAPGKLYQYYPLDTGSNEIRLLDLLPGTASDNIRVSLQIISLCTGSNAGENLVSVSEVTPNFEALSYAWGSRDEPVHIEVGSSGTHTLSVTRNLGTALLYLRYHDRPRKLWIDAICVNQNDLEERSRQVPRMSDIYSKASRVVVWLGQATKHTPAALETVEHIASKVVIDFKRGTMCSASSKHSERHWGDRYIDLPDKRRVSQVISDLLIREWFERLWVWQEVALANDATIIMCGSNSTLWTDFSKFIHCLRWKPVWPDDQSRRIQLAYSICSQVSFLHTRSLMRALYNSRNSKCSDPRDRIYALLSLIVENDKQRIRPDYTKPFRQIYKDLVLDLALPTRTKAARGGGSLDILAFCSSTTSIPSLNLPTWVPDWRMALGCHRIDWCYASESIDGRILCEAEHIDPDILRVTGMESSSIDTVLSSTLSPPSQFRNAKEFEQSIRRMAPRNVLSSDYANGSSLLEAFCRTLVTNMVSDAHQPLHPALPDLKDAMAYVKWILETPNTQRTSKHGDSRDLAYFESGVRKFLMLRSFFILHNGHIGIGPQDIKPSDRVCVILGCNTPIIIRPTLRGQFRIIGGCYVHGLMDCEAFLGPLPRHHRSITLYDDRGHIGAYAFVDTSNSRIQFEDPRSMPTISGWHKQYNNGLFEYQNREGELFSKLAIQPEDLRRWGVRLETFDLI